MGMKSVFESLDNIVRYAEGGAHEMGTCDVELVDLIGKDLHSLLHDFEVLLDALNAPVDEDDHSVQIPLDVENAKDRVNDRLAKYWD